MHLTARWNATHVVFTIIDDGQGFAPEMMDNIGEPYVTSRRYEDKGDKAHSGLGLGLVHRQDPAGAVGCHCHVLQSAAASKRRAGPDLMAPKRFRASARQLLTGQVRAAAEGMWLKTCKFGRRRRRAAVAVTLWAGFPWPKGLAARGAALDYVCNEQTSKVPLMREDNLVTEDLSFKQDELPADRSLVIVDDDRAFLQRLVRAMELRGFEVRFGHSVAEGVDLIREKAPAFAVVDMRLEDGSGLDVIAELAKARADSRAIVLTGYGNIATAVTAVKLGAVDYLAKPADADDVTDALLAPTDSKAPPPENPMSADRVRWEHIQRVYELCNRNVSETARRLNMHRRTLQRILAKRAPK